MFAGDENGNQVGYKGYYLLETENLRVQVIVIFYSKNVSHGM